MHTRVSVRCVMIRHKTTKKRNIGEEKPRIADVSTKDNIVQYTYIAIPIHPCVSDKIYVFATHENSFIRSYILSLPEALFCTASQTSTTNPKKIYTDSPKTTDTFSIHLFEL